MTPKKMLAVIILVAAITVIAVRLNNRNQVVLNLNSQMQKVMKIESNAFENNGAIPTEYTCNGKSLQPILNISEVPDGAAGLALIVDDPDAPSGDFVHWTLWNLPPRTQEIDGSNLPAGTTEGKNGAGQNGWIAPCPPGGIHHYNFKLYALDTTLSLPSSAGKTELEEAMKGHIMETALLTGLYENK